MTPALCDVAVGLLSIMVVFGIAAIGGFLIYRGSEHDKD